MAHSTLKVTNIFLWVWTLQKKTEENKFQFWNKKKTMEHVNKNSSELAVLKNSTNSKDPISMMLWGGWQIGKGEWNNTSTRYRYN